MARLQEYTDEEIIAALKKQKGMVYLAASEVGCSAWTIYERVKRNPLIGECIQSERGKVLDVAEQKLWNAIENGDPWAIKMALMTIGKDRGYVERQELTGKDGGSLKIGVEDMTEEEVDGELDRLEAAEADLKTHEVRKKSKK